MCTFLSGRLFTWFWGGWDGMMLTLAVFVVVEALSSTLLTISKKSTKKDWKQWIAKQVTLFLIVGIGNITDCYLTSGGNAFRTIIILFYVGCESGTILKNARDLGLPVPQGFFKFLLELGDVKDNDIR